MIRISATNLESFRRWLLNEESTIEEMIAYLKRETPPNEAMLAGSAFHKVLENAQYGDELNIIEQDGFTFDLTSFESEIALPAIREFKIEKPAIIADEPVTFVGVVDALSINEVFDHKLTSNPNAENYLDSMQWRCYLDWFNVDKFTYNFFHSYKPANKDIYQIKGVLQVSFYRYAEIKRDIENISIQFVNFVKGHIPELVQ